MRPHERSGGAIYCHPASVSLVFLSTAGLGYRDYETELLNELFVAYCQQEQLTFIQEQPLLKNDR